MRPAARAPWRLAAAGGDEEQSSRVVGSGSAATARKKGLGVRTWLAVDASGVARTMEAGKPAIMRRTGLPARDLRILDPILSYPSTVLGREHAIVVNLEHIKAILTANEVLLLNAADPAVQPFVCHLQRRLLHRRTIASEKEERSQEWQDEFDTEEQQAKVASPSPVSGDLQRNNLESDAKRKRGTESTRFAESNGPRALPFEFVALEACLESACSCLEDETIALEKEAHPALDKLTSKISTLNLERVRQIKSRLVAITGRVQKVRDELEHLLDDDDDMAEMYLTDKLLQQQLVDGSPQSSFNEEDGSIDDKGLRADILLDENDVINETDSLTTNNHQQDQLLSRQNTFSGNSHRTRSFSTSSRSKHVEVEELEMLLEAYFVQIDSTLNKLSTLREYVDDTEDYINIMLDDKQNHLLQMGVMLTTATLIVSAFVVLAGIFGMNIQNDLFDEKKSGTTEFVWTVGGGAAGSLLLYVLALAWCKHKRLLE